MSQRSSEGASQGKTVLCDVWSVHHYGHYSRSSGVGNYLVELGQALVACTAC